MAKVTTAAAVVIFVGRNNSQAMIPHATKQLSQFRHGDVRPLLMQFPLDILSVVDVGKSSDIDAKIVRGS